jgi:hypothetical protein
VRISLWGCPGLGCSPHFDISTPLISRELLVPVITLLEEYIFEMELLNNLPAVAAVTCISFLFCQSVFKVVRSYRSPIPWAHWTAGLSSFWILWIRYSYRENRTIHEAHKKLGPVIRLGPDEVSVNCVKGGIQTIYAGGFDKHAWYSNLFDNYG